MSLPALLRSGWRHFCSSVPLVWYRSSSNRLFVYLTGSSLLSRPWRRAAWRGPLSFRPSAMVVHRPARRPLECCPGVQRGRHQLCLQPGRRDARASRTIDWRPGKYPRTPGRSRIDPRATRCGLCPTRNRRCCHHRADRSRIFHVHFGDPGRSETAGAPGNRSAYRTGDPAIPST